MNVRNVAAETLDAHPKVKTHSSQTIVQSLRAREPGRLER